MSVTALIVDDSAAARQIIGYHLRQAGCTIVGEAANAADALKLFRELKPSIVSLDLMMPNKDNLDSLGLVRAMKKEAPEIAVIVVSVIPFEKMRQSFIDEGVFAYVVKPFNDFALDAIRVKLRRTFPELAAVKPSA
jgi:two-component system, chemotaxis family, chemotaxis protein CheY